MSKKTPVYEEHIKLNGKMVDFAGWLMPVQYTNIKEEHINVRTNVGLFDVSHMGEIRVKGANAIKTLQWLTTNDVERLQNGEAQYSLLSNKSGGLVDDLIVYCLEQGQDYLLCVNASNKDKDFKWILENNLDADVVDESDIWAQFAVQGPKAPKLLAQVFSSEVDDVASFNFATLPFKGSQCIVAMTGYTGEKGAEIFVPKDQAVELWQALMSEGQALNIMAIGLGARDTLRTEMKYSLYGQEIDDSTNPYAAGLGWVVKPKDKDFIGKDVILAEKEKGLSQKLIGFEMIERGIARHGYNVFSFDNKQIGRVTSGTVSPSLNTNIGIAYLDKEFASEGQEILVEIRSKMVKAKVVKTPFVRVI